VTGSFEEVIAAGDHRRSLEALRDELAKALVTADANVVAQVAGRLQAVLAALADLPSECKASRSDELARRRKDRLAGAGE